ncbi:hypothetical protein NONO_c18040 [Nocardia nova SH22a]|uniref:Uncharacterized protein n=1 Tax=Nocardia nova SH22a TaxID=1415166 RepID=W5TBQ7_9NOCA|nr:hypothetical protein [Nocardia nova]AHH16604.1 hypothetical protein NONO_c18040 [Nocardia nova SH22a]
MIDIITVRGTGEPMNGPGNMLTNVVEHLDPWRFRTIGDCPFPGTVGPVGAGVDGPSVRRNIDIGLASAVAMVRASPNLVGIIGYSLGALIVTALRELQAQGLYLDCELAFSACVANPKRRAGDSIDPNPHGYGITGERADFLPNVPHFEAANPADIITSSSAGSPLRAVADGMAAFSAAELGEWSLDMAGRFRSQRFQPVSLDWWRRPVQTWQVYDEAGRGIIGYLDRTAHIIEYVRGGYCARLADRINMT